LAELPRNLRLPDSKQPKFKSPAAPRKGKGIKTLADAAGVEEEATTAILKAVF
jgi:hypothetical protein